MGKLLPRPLLVRAKALYTIYHKWAVARLNRRWLSQLITAHPAGVQSGPFKGMRYGDLGLAGETVSRWLGAYEMELHQVVESLCRGPYVTVINIGCAEGYYTVGFAQRLPQAHVYAFDLDPEAVKQCRHLAAINGISHRVTVAGRCTVDSLSSLIRGDTLIMCDCEGAELELLDPARIPQLAAADLLVEVHDFINPAISAVLFSRFGGTHSITRIKSRGRDPADFPVLRRLSLRDRTLALDEFRPGPMEWFHARHSSSRDQAQL
jgi:precorrin-6B methylase 2